MLTRVHPTIALLGLLTSALGCAPTKNEPEPTPTQTQPAPEPSAQEAPKDQPSPAQDDVVSPDAGASAIAAYRRAVEAWNSHEGETAYFEAFADPLTCFYGKQDYAVSSLKSARGGNFEELKFQGSFTVAVVDQSENRVTLVDWGYYSKEPKDEHGVGWSLHPHRKAVVMERRDQTWKIAAEFGPNDAACIASFGDVFDGLETPRIAKKCRKVLEDGKASCAESCKGRSPSVHGCGGCVEGQQSLVEYCGSGA